MPIDETCLLAVGVEHSFFCLLQRFSAGLVETAGVLGAFAETGEHESSIHLAVLLVCFFLFDRYFASLERLDVRFFGRDVKREILFGFGETGNPLCVEQSDRPTKHDVRQIAPVEELVD